LAKKDTVELEITGFALAQRATHCDCEVETTFDVEPHCLLDNRADNLLALARRAASDRPCEAVLETVSLDSTQRFGYDAAGRLEVIDDYVDGTHRERTAYRYNANGYLEHALSIDPEEALIYRRTTWFYREDRTLERIERDGRVDENMDDPDRLAEVVTRYTLTSNGWQLRRESRVPAEAEISMLGFNLDARTFETDDDGGMTSFRYLNATENPNDFVAVPTLEKVIVLGIHEGTASNGDVIEVVWDGAGIVSQSVSNATQTLEVTFGYTCP
jgi:hypothetical protein